MPKRLVQKSAVVEKGLPFEEEGDFIIVQRALDKVHIDEIIEISKKNREDEVIHYKYEEAIKGPIAQKKKPVKKEKTAEATETERDVKREEINIKEIRPDGTEFSEKIEKTEKKTDTIAFPFPPPPPPPPPGFQGGEIVKRTTTTKVIDPPDHHHHHQDLIVPDHHGRQSDSELRREIRALEAERAALQLERNAERSSDWRMVEAERIRDGRRIRQRSRAPPKLVGLALATLS